MSLTSGFFNSVNNDRLYDAEQMSAIFDGLINDGIYDTIGTGFQVTPASELTVNVGVGRAWLNHCWISNDTVYPITLGAASASLGRIDTVCLKVDRSLGVRSCSIVVLNGVTSASPVAPDVPADDTDNGVYYHPIADISVAAGTTAITQSMITNRVGLSTGTPYVTGIISATTLDQLWAQLEGEFMDWWDTIRAVLDDNIALRLQNEIDHITPTEETMNLYGFSHMNPPPAGKEYKAFSTDAILKKVDDKINAIDTGNIGDVMVYDGDISAISDNFVAAEYVSGDYAMFRDDENGTPSCRGAISVHSDDRIRTQIQNDYTTSTQNGYVCCTLYKDGYVYALLLIYAAGASLTNWASMYVVQYDEHAMTKINEHAIVGVSSSNCSVYPPRSIFDSHGRMAFYSNVYGNGASVLVFSNDNGITWSNTLVPSANGSRSEGDAIIYNHFLVCTPTKMSASSNSRTVSIDSRIYVFDFDAGGAMHATNYSTSIQTTYNTSYNGNVSLMYSYGVLFIKTQYMIDFSSGYTQSAWLVLLPFTIADSGAITIHSTYVYKLDNSGGGAQNNSAIYYYSPEDDAYYVVIMQHAASSITCVIIYYNKNASGNPSVQASTASTNIGSTYALSTFDGLYANGTLMLGYNNTGNIEVLLKIQHGVVLDFVVHAGITNAEKSIMKNSVYPTYGRSVFEQNGIYYWVDAAYPANIRYCVAVTPTQISGAGTKIIKRISL